MRNQNSGLPQPRPSQQQGLNDRQILEQQLRYKQYQEFQRQCQFQQQQQQQQQQQHQQQQLGGRQHHSIAQLSEIARQAGTTRQSLPVLSGMPINNASNYPWTGELMGGEPKTTSNPQYMFHAGNMSQRNGPPMRGVSGGPMFSHNQGQSMRPMVFQQHGEQSLYGTPVSSTRYSNHHPQSQGMSHGFTDLSNKPGGNPSEKGMMQPSLINYFQGSQSAVPAHSYSKEGISVANQGFQGKALFGSTSAHDLNSGDMLVNLQHVDQFPGQVQEFQGVQERDNWSGKLQENRVSQVGPSRGMTNLDPTEEKLLFGTGNDNNLSGLFGNSTDTDMGGYHHANPAPSNDQFSAFPSVQSGSWSALMLDALDASSSDTGVQEEWSGSSFQKTEPSTRNQYAFLNDNGKQKMPFDENNHLSASSLTSRSLPLFNDAEANPNHPMFPSVQKSTEFAYQQNETLQPDVSNESSQLSSKEANNMQLDLGHQRKQIIGANIHEQTSFDNASNSVWAGQMYGQSVSTRNSADMEHSMQNRQLVWDHQQKMPMHNVSSLPIDKSNGWNINQSPGGDDTSNVPDNDMTEGHAEQTDIKKAMHMERDHGGNARRVTGSQVAGFPAATDSGAFQMNQQVKQHAYPQNHLDYGRHATNDYPKDYKVSENVARYQNQLRRNQQARDSSMYTTDKNEMGELYNHARESSNAGDIHTESYLSNHSHTSHHSDSDGGSRENSMLAGNDSGSLVSSRQKSSGQSGRNTGGPRKFQYHPMGNLEMDLRKEQLPDLQRNAKAGEEVQPSGTLPSHDSPLSFDGSASNASQNNPGGHASHNMLELLHKVDQSRNNNTMTHFSLSEHNRPSQTRNNTPDESVHLQHDHSSNLQGYGLKLAPPSEWQPASGYDLASQTSLRNAKNTDGRSLTSQGTKNDNFDSKSNMHVQMNNQNSHVGIRGNPSASTGRPLPYARDRSTAQQQQWQQQKHVPSVSGSQLIDHSNLSIGSQVSTDSHVKPFSHPRQARGSNDGNLFVQPAQGSLRSVASPTPPTRFNPSVNTCAPVGSQFQSGNSDPSESPNSSSLPRSSGQQLPLGETRSMTQPPMSTGMPQQGGFSSMLHKVLSNISAQRLPMIQAQKIIPRLPHSTGSLPNNMATNMWTPQKTEDHAIKAEGSAQPDCGTSSTNSQKSICAEEYPVIGQSSQYMAPNMMVSAPRTSEASREQGHVSVSSPAYPHHQELSRRKHANDSSLDSQKEHVSVPNADAQSQNYSLMQQAQNIKGSDSDPRAGKRLRGTTFGADAPKSEGIAGQKYMYGQNTGFRELDAATQQNSFSSDEKMLSFSRETGDESANTPSQLINREKHPEDLLNSVHKNLQNHNHSLTDIAKLTLLRGDKRPQINSQMSSSWFDLYRPCKNGQVIASYDGPGNSQTSTQVSEKMDSRTGMEQGVDATHDSSNIQTSAHVSERMDNSTVMEKIIDATEDGAPLQNALSTALAANENPLSFYPPSIVIDNNTVLISKKRKTRTSELLPWHKEVTLGSRRLLNISLAERDWAKATNRRAEKGEAGFDMIEAGSLVTPAQRRLILTTQLMQMLLPSVAASFLRADATTSYENVTYSIAKSALGDATSFVSYSGRDSLTRSSCVELKSDKSDSSEEAMDHSLGKKLEGFIGRTRKMEGDLLRMERAASILDVRVECHDLDRCSIINRLAKFHGRAQAEGPSVSQVAPNRVFPQRQATPQAMSSKLPDDVKCISL